jgi:Zn-dependent metalloprotease
MNKPVFFFLFFLGALGGISLLWSRGNQSNIHAATSLTEMASLTPVQLPKAPDPQTFTPVIDSPKENAQKVADEFLSGHRDEWQIQSYHELKADVFPNSEGTKVKYTVFQDGIPIVGMNIIVEVGADHQILSVTNGYHPVARADLEENAALPAEEIASALGDQYTIQPGTIAHSQRVLFFQPDLDEVELAYTLPLIPNQGNQAPVVQATVRASDGEILQIAGPQGTSPIK